jgi:hypothetical protein
LTWSDEELNSPEVVKSLHMWWKVVIYYTLRYAVIWIRFDTDPFHWITDPDTLFFSDFQYANKK